MFSLIAFSFTFAVLFRAIAFAIEQEANPGDFK
jgi:hypothetical protein